MACNVQDWSLKDLTDALNNKHIDKKRIAVPLFQRGKRWKRDQEEKFIDSLKSGYPVGTMLFYETIEDNQSVYLLVDGLQRGNTIRKYITKPTEFFSSETIGDEICTKLLTAELGISSQPWFSRAYLNPLRAQGYIGQSLPKKPTSPLQRNRLLRKGKDVPV